jgi:hypothetical protein
MTPAKHKKKKKKKQKKNTKGRVKKSQGEPAAATAITSASLQLRHTPSRTLQGGDYDGQCAVAQAEIELARGLAQLQQQQLLHSQVVSNAHRQLAEARRDLGTARDALEKQRLGWVRKGAWVGRTFWAWVDVSKGRSTRMGEDLKAGNILLLTP